MILELTQAVIAVLVVAGGGFAALTGSTHTTEIMPFVALVFGYYFGKQVQRLTNGPKGPGSDKNA